jgi:hypothetical protein
VGQDGAFPLLGTIAFFLWIATASAGRSIWVVVLLVGAIDETRQSTHPAATPTSTTGWRTDSARRPR